MGGAEYQAKLLLEQALARNCFDIVYLTRNVSKDYSPAGYRIVQLPTRRPLAGTFLLDSMSLYANLKQLSPDVIYQRVGCTYTGVGAYYAKRHRCKLVWHVSSDADLKPDMWHFSIASLLKQMENKILDYGVKNAQAIVVQSQEQSELLRQYHRRNATALIPNFHPIPTVSVLKSSNPVKVLWIANIKPLKQPELFLKLAADLLDYPQAEFILVGKPPKTWSEWPKMLANAQALKNFRFMGEQSQDTINALIDSSHMLVNTSLYEGFPNTFIQAWQRSVPVVSLNVDPDRLLTNQSLGFCAHGNYEIFKNSIVTLLNEHETRRRMGEVAKNYSHEKFSLQNAEQLISNFFV